MPSAKTLRCRSGSGDSAPAIELGVAGQSIPVPGGVVRLGGKVYITYILYKRVIDGHEQTEHIEK